MKLTPKEVYEYAKGLRQITDQGSKKIKKGFYVTKEILENNQEKLLKQKSISTLFGFAVNLARTGQNPKLPDALHNKMLAYRIFSQEKSPDTNKVWKNQDNKRTAEKYFEVLKCFEETGKVPMVHREWRIKYNKDPNVEKYRMNWKNRIIINPLSKEYLEILIKNPYYALKYAKCAGRFEKDIEHKLLNESPITYSRRRTRTKRRSGKTPAEFRDVMGDTCDIILNYCNKFGVGLPLVFHNIILWKAASNERYDNYQIHMGFGWENHKLNREQKEHLQDSGFYCKYKRHIKEYNQFVSNLPNFISKKKITKETKMSDVLKKRLSKKDRIYLETYINVNQLDIDKTFPQSLFLEKFAA